MPQQKSIKRKDRIIKCPPSVPEIQLNDRAAAAFLYAYRGWRVLPLFGIRHGTCRCPKGRLCDQPGAHPMVKSGVDGATTDLVTIQSWWRRWPHANIGIATGRASNVVGVVIETKAGSEGLDKVQQQRGPLPPTLKAFAGSKCKQLLFAYPPVENVPPSHRVRPPKGVQVLSDGGFILGPGSVDVGGKTLGWVKGKSIRSLLPASLPAKWQCYL